MDLIASAWKPGDLDQFRKPSVLRSSRSWNRFWTYITLYYIYRERDIVLYNIYIYMSAYVYIYINSIYVILCLYSIIALQYKWCIVCLCVQFHHDVWLTGLVGLRWACLVGHGLGRHWTMPDGIPVPECHIGQEDVAEKLHPAVQGSCGAHSGHKAIKDNIYLYKTWQNHAKNAKQRLPYEKSMMTITDWKSHRCQETHCDLWRWRKMQRWSYGSYGSYGNCWDVA